MAETTLFHKSHNSGGESILLIHGGFSDSSEWDGVWPLLAKHDYHLLIPDLPSHGNSVDIHPFEIGDTVRRLAELIKVEARGGVTHVVGISIGGHIAAALASQHPSCVLSLVVSGFNMFTPNLFTPVLPLLVYGVQRGSGFARQPFAEWDRFCRGLGSLGLTRDVFNILISSRELHTIACRTLVVAATRAGVSADNINHSRRIFETVVAGNGSQIVQHQGMRHSWNEDEPQIFADMVKCWITAQELPDGFDVIP
ncbi:Alpha/beta hydrolase fold-1 [Fusarium austroafricanum]|uniref:Alpha/beta hydrolase fold-1 n=1 Tax=Fusarium austroafricanum TaxID=2364996 RepID=A0A8H4NYA9_9HYPO|nr:Alpha/beta hydrolase fold-1 [Fusarium austroafricanum]